MARASTFDARLELKPFVPLAKAARRITQPENPPQAERPAKSLAKLIAFQPM